MLLLSTLSLKALLLVYLGNIEALFSKSRPGTDHISVIFSVIYTMLKFQPIREATISHVTDVIGQIPALSQILRKILFILAACHVCCLL